MPTLRYMAACASLAVALGPLAEGTEYDLREEPLRVEEREMGGTTRTVVHWGRLAEDRPRSAEECERERRAILDYLSSPEVRAMALARSEQMSKLALVVGELEIAKAKEWEATTPIETTIPSAHNQKTRVEDLKPALAGLSWDYRRRTRVVFFDQANAAHRDWLARWYPARKRVAVDLIYAVGRQPKEAYETWRDTVDIPVLRANHDHFAATYQVRGLPAVVTFPTEGTVRIVEGLYEQRVAPEDANRRMGPGETPPPLLEAP